VARVRPNASRFLQVSLLKIRGYSHIGRPVHGSPRIFDEPWRLHNKQNLEGETCDNPWRRFSLVQGPPCRRAICARENQRRWTGDL